MQWNASSVREILSEILGRVLKTGGVSEVRHKGTSGGIVPVQISSKLARLVPRDYLRCDPESIIHLDWLGEAGGID